MKNIKFYLIIICFMSCNSSSFSQESISISEGSDTNICGKIVIVDALWMSEGTIKADISILEKQNSKPITGGYKKGDEITISSEPGCTYYIYSIVKYGHSKSKGSVTLSKTAPVIMPEVYENNFSENEGSSFPVGPDDWFISSIRNEEGNTFANITITQNTALVENLVLSKEDLIWLGKKLYKVVSIKPRSEFIKTDPERIYEPLPGKIEFKAVTEYLPQK